MTSLLVFIMPGSPGQLATGAMITFIFLLLTMRIRPYCTGMLLNTAKPLFLIVFSHYACKSDPFHLASHHAVLLNSVSIVGLVAQFLTLVSEISYSDHRRHTSACISPPSADYPL